MMKNILLSFLFGFTLIISSGQSLPNSFLEKYNAAKSDSAKGKCIHDYIVEGSHPDSIMNRRVLLLLAWFKDHNDPVGADYTGIHSSRILNVTGDFTTGLNQSLDILTRFEKRNDEYGQMRAYISIAGSFDRSTDYENAISYDRKAMAIATARNNQGTLAGIMNDISSCYAQANLPDSGIIYAQEAVNISESMKDNASLAYHLGTLAENYIAKHEFDIALPFLRKAIGYSKSEDQSWALTYNTNDMAQ